ncbi:MAG: aspartate--tRNA ligase [Candidatus Omnitrophica bacterium]|nr:aspartate--tRNA ligase [Candidatus Omnitrophota bacterium]
MLRTHTCGDLTVEELNKEVVLCGWVASRRDHGKLIFIDIRDRYGITQIIFLPKPNTETYEKAKKLRNEDVVKIKGMVNSRPKKTENPKISTGYVEICAQELDILSAASDLPFNVEDNVEAGEETRLMHRYLDLRRNSVSQKIILRHKLNQEFRKILNEQNFLEIETPFLTKSTPEGARDYLVPSRLNENKFYALPQSPQLFKQILMVGGMDRYYQIARCFRDEDLRKDRQPEFTQLDLEMSFVDEEDILSIVENMFASVFSKLLGVEIKTPFLRIPHKEAIEKYGTDKPDLRNPNSTEKENEYKFLWVVDFPLFEYNEENKRWQSCHHPFTAPNEQDIPLLDTDLSKVRSRSYDLVLNGEELGSGSIRINSFELQKKIFEILGISELEAEEKFGFLLRSFKYGVPPHGGAAFGLDRLCAIITKSSSIREVIAFPKTQRGICPLSEAPSYIEEKQLDELKIKLIKEEKED